MEEYMSDHPELAWALVILGSLVVVMFSATIWVIRTLPDKVEERLNDLKTADEEKRNKCRLDERQHIEERLRHICEVNSRDHQVIVDRANSAHHRIDDVTRRVETLEGRPI
jgi:hypothetical protein